MFIILFLMSVVIAYLLGSVCSAVIVCQLFGLPDPRSQGSKNPGATNVLRIAGKHYAIVVLIADMLKGFLPVFLAKILGAGPVTLSFTCLAAVVGHIFPMFFDFKGGKGVATALGGLLAMHFFLGTMVLISWGIVAYFSHLSSLASLVAVALAPFYSVLSFGRLSAFPALLFMAVLIFYKHSANITRLMDGTEPKMDL